MKTIRLLESVSGLDYNYRYGQIVSVEDTRADQLIAKAIAELYTGDGEYLEYVAKITQSGVSSPVATVLNGSAPNFYSGITFGREDVFVGGAAGDTEGVYHVYFPSAIDTGKLFFQVFWLFDILIFGPWNEIVSVSVVLPHGSNIHFSSICSK